LTPQRHRRVDGVDYLAALLVGLLAGWSAYRAGLQRGMARWGVRWGLLAFGGSMAAYLALAASGKAATAVLSRWGYAASPLLALVGAALGWIAGLLWRAFASRGTP